MQQINNHIAKLLFYFISSIWLFSISTLFSQEIGSWNTLNIRYTIDEKLTLNGEGQIRSLNFYNTFHYFEYKTWVNYKFLPNAIVSLGIGNYQTFNENGNFRLPKNNNEVRIWPQLTLNQKLGALNIEQRYRVESRFTTNGYILSVVKKKDLNLIKLVQVMSSFLQTKNLILKEIEFSLLLVLNQQNQSKYN